MTAPRFFITEPLVDDGDPAPGEGASSAAEPLARSVVVPLSAEDLHHAVDVMRLQAGEELTVAEPSGVVWRLQAEEVSRATLRASVLERIEPSREPRVTLVQGVAKGPKMDRIVEQAVEVGVFSVVPVVSERTVVRLDEDKRSERGERWRRVARAAAKQARRSVVPRIEDPVPLPDALPGIAAHDVVLVVWEEAPAGESVSRVLEKAAAKPRSSVALVIGPEGGLSSAEVEALESVGGRPCSLGPTILRTETAGLVALALTFSALGGLGSDA
jgi:16S rRNA (uracil1498-N3)-methyltransferase